MDLWASLPTDLLLVIFLSLEPTVVICCAGVCKPWRRAIIGNASILGPHLDGFGPSLLLGVFHNCRNAACLRRTTGPFQSVLPWNEGGDNENAASVLPSNEGGDNENAAAHYLLPWNEGDDNETAAAHSLIPASAASGGGLDRDLYTKLLCSRDGFILLMARSGHDRSLCLCNPVTGHCTFLQSAYRGWYTSYFLLPSYDDLLPSGTASNMVPRILALHTETRTTNDDREVRILFNVQVLSYQIFSTSGDNAGKWGPVEHSAGELQQGLWLWIYRWTTVVSPDAVYWLAGPGRYITCVLALDVRNGRTWTTELPKQCHFRMECPLLAILATSSDGRPSLMQMLKGCQDIQVWVQTGEAGWTLQQTISIGSECLTSGGRIPRLIELCAFCPRSRCVVAMSLESDLELLIDLGSRSSCPPVMCIGNYGGLDCCPYEIDCSSTYISRMKHF